MLQASRQFAAAGRRSSGAPLLHQRRGRSSGGGSLAPDRRRVLRVAASADGNGNGNGSTSVGGSNGVGSSLPAAGLDQQQQQQEASKAAGLGGLLSSVLASEAAHSDPASTSTSTASAGGNRGAATAAAALGALGGVAALVCGGYALREPIRAFLNFFIAAVEDWGPWGYVAYALVYAALEIVAVPAIPLTMTAGAIFGPAGGIAVVSVAATAAATASFLIARHLARDKIMAFAKGNRRFAAIDRAISRDGLKFVTLLRLSPLLPLALSNYVYGLTSVDLGSYVLGTCIGMLPGTCAYVSAGHFGKAVLVEGAGEGLGVAPWQVALGATASLLAIGYVGQLAKRAIDEADAEAGGGGSGGSGGGGGSGNGGSSGGGPRLVPAGTQ